MVCIEDFTYVSAEVFGRCNCDVGIAYISLLPPKKAFVHCMVLYMTMSLTVSNSAGNPLIMWLKK